MEPVTLTAELWFEHEPQLASAPGAAPNADQTWDWDEAEAVLARCTHRALVTAPAEGFVAALNAAIERSQPAAVWLPHCRRAARPAALGALEAFVNVRFFVIEGTTERLVDTLGLHVLGLPDLQCASGEEDPVEIAELLYDVAGYLLDEGDVIEDGDDLAERGWVCHDAESVTEPDRRMLTLSRRTDPRA